ncbi:diacylglycerol kinase family protein [Candidatus Beckwithbacteria bacterium]|nr:diacylglycerol kinase family protein [Candidatus Beckwithbacteria bacterium]
MKIFKPFADAIRGIILSIKQEKHVRFHLFATFFILILSYSLKINIYDFFICLLLFAIIWSGELFNTCIEQICNILRDKYKLPYEGSRDIRDIAAGAVLFQAIMAAIIGVIIFWKYLF